MGGVSTPGGDGGLNVELNLVPFIDLLSSLVLFLLLSAVWIQIASIQASVESKSGRQMASNSAPDTRLSVNLSEHGYEITWPPALAKLPKSIGLKERHFDREGLIQIIKSALLKNKIGSGAISANDAVPYGEMVKTIDALKDGGIASVAISTE
jgi:biopolymer transport protein ExbD